MSVSNKLTALAVEKMKEPGCYADGNGLYLQVSRAAKPKANSKPSAPKSWLFRFMRDGKARKMGLGPTHTVSLAEAREAALQCRKKIRAGVDPIDERKAGLAASKTLAAQAMTFKECASKYITANEASWKNPKHRAQWPSSLATYAYPVIGDLPIAGIDLNLVLKVIEPIWHTKSETAGRVRGRIETVLDWATTRGLRTGENPARWRGHLDNLLPPQRKVRPVKHHKALPYAELPSFMEQLRAMEGASARALEFAILTATRTNETIVARHSEIDLGNAMWIIPAERMKAAREHRVPLSERALEIITALPRERNNPHVFIGAKGGQPLSSMALLMTLRRMERGDLTVHGFRSTFRDWCAERTAYPHELAEMALAHVVGDKTEAAYRRGDMLEKRRRMMADWASHCETPSREGVVISLRSST